MPAMLKLPFDSTESVRSDFCFTKTTIASNVPCATLWVRALASDSKMPETRLPLSSNPAKGAVGLKSQASPITRKDRPAIQVSL
jgi:hypothetical protein